MKHVHNILHIFFYKCTQHITHKKDKFQNYDKTNLSMGGYFPNERGNDVFFIVCANKSLGKNQDFEELLRVMNVVHQVYFFFELSFLEVSPALNILVKIAKMLSI